MYLARSRIRSGLTISIVIHLSNSEVHGNSRGIFIADSILFSKEQHNAVIWSNIGIAAMVCAVDWASAQFGVWNVIKFYGIPWLEVTHWCSSFLISVLLFTNRLDTVIMITYLHHTASDIPHYRGKTWNFQRGAAATIDRDFLGWQGRFFLHDVAHYHVIHHVSLIINPLPLIIAEHSSNSFSPRCRSASTF